MFAAYCDRGALVNSPVSWTSNYDIFAFFKAKMGPPQPMKCLNPERTFKYEGKQF